MTVLFSSCHREEIERMNYMAKLLSVRVFALGLMFSSPTALLAGVTASGAVVDSAGLEVAHAVVQAVPIPTTDTSVGVVGDRPDPWIQADSHGRFQINLPSGRYKVLAKDEVEGYPDPIFLLNADPNAKFPEISVEQTDISDVQVMLGTKGGILHGDLRDETTQETVPKCKVTIRDASQHDAFVEVFANEIGHFQFTVPNKPIQIMATAPGYRVAFYGDGAKLILSGGEHRRVIIGLSRKSRP